VPGGGRAGSQNLPTHENGNIEISVKGMSKLDRVQIRFLSATKKGKGNQ
jgi:hypothetical protein